MITNPRVYLCANLEQMQAACRHLEAEFPHTYRWGGSTAYGRLVEDCSNDTRATCCKGIWKQRRLRVAIMVSLGCETLDYADEMYWNWKNGHDVYHMDVAGTPTHMLVGDSNPLLLL